MLLLEINEFNPELMRQAAVELGATHLQKILALRSSATHTDDAEERFGLDPWVQWVSIHTGVPSREHGIHHLADAVPLQHPQLWETLGQAGVRCGVWGAMNGRLGSGDGMDFFVPDPWTYHQRATPPELNALLALPVYYARHYGQLRLAPLLAACCRTLSFLLRPASLAALLPLLPAMLSRIARSGLRDHILFVLFDLVNVALFVRYHRRYRPQFSVLFLNSLAHLQHHHWSATGQLSREMRDVFLVFDQAMGLLFDNLPADEALVVANAFSQHCTADNRDFLYRQKDLKSLLQSVGLRIERVAPLMTNDSHLFFASAEDALQAKAVLDAATLAGQPVFHTRLDPQSPSSLFCQLVYWGQVDSQAMMQLGGQALRFLDHFYCVTQRTGSHCAEGHVFSSRVFFPERLYNHDIGRYILQHYGVRA